MKRDMDLCRDILRQIEAHSDPNRPVELEAVGRTSQDIAYQVYLLDQACLIEATDASDGDEINFIPLRLTWQGHEFLDAARDDIIWRKAKDKVLGAAGGLTFDLL